jgi:hypothetical protein
MKTTILALAMSLTVSGLAQESKPVTDKAAAPTVSYYTGTSSISTPKPSDPDYIGVVHHSHKLRNILIGTGIAAGTAAVVVLAHGSTASHGSSGQYSTGLNPVPTVFK